MTPRRGGSPLPFFFNDTATTEIYPLSLHDALPICLAGRVAEQPAHALVGTVEHLPVHPLVVHGQAQGAAHPDVLQHRPAHVEHIALESRWQLVVELALDQLAPVDRKSVV